MVSELNSLGNGWEKIKFTNLIIRKTKVIYGISYSFKLSEKNLLWAGEGAPVDGAIALYRYDLDLIPGTLYGPLCPNRNDPYAQSQSQEVSPGHSWREQNRTTLVFCSISQTNQQDEWHPGKDDSMGITNSTIQLHKSRVIVPLSFVVHLQLITHFNIQFFHTF